MYAAVFQWGPNPLFLANLILVLDVWIIELQRRDEVEIRIVSKVLPHRGRVCP